LSVGREQSVEQRNCRGELMAEGRVWYTHRKIAPRVVVWTVAADGRTVVCWRRIDLLLLAQDDTADLGLAQSHHARRLRWSASSFWSSVDARRRQRRPVCGR